MKYLSFYLWFISLSLMASRSITFSQMAGFLLSWIKNIPLCVYARVRMCVIYVCVCDMCMCVYTHAHILFTHSFMDGHLGYFHILVIMNTAAMNVGVQIFIQDGYFISLHWYLWFEKGVSSSSLSQQSEGTANLFLCPGRLYNMLQSSLASLAMLPGGVRWWLASLSR